LQCGLAIMVTGAAGLATACFATPDASVLPRDAAGPTARISFSKAPVLGATSFGVLLRGRPNSVALWQFGYRKEVLVQRRARFDALGRSGLRLVAPDVRHRAVCDFALRDPQNGWLRRGLAVYPAGMLASAGGRIRRWRIGVIDESSSVAAALRAERIVFADLRTRLERDAFRGGMVILNGFRSSNELTEHCRSLKGRIQGGLDLLIVNPPSGWSGFGIRRVELKAPRRAPLELADDLQTVILPEDIGEGPWSAALSVDGERNTLAWLLTADRAQAASGPATRPSRERPQYPMIVAGRRGGGRLVVALLPQLAAADRDAVGRTMFNELILWMLRNNIVDAKDKE